MLSQAAMINSVPLGPEANMLLRALYRYSLSSWCRNRHASHESRIHPAGGLRCVVHVESSAFIICAFFPASRKWGNICSHRGRARNDLFGVCRLNGLLFCHGVLVPLAYPTLFPKQLF